MTLKMADWKIRTDLSHVKTIQYDAISGLLDCFYTNEDIWNFNLPFLKSRLRSLATSSLTDHLVLIHNSFVIFQTSSNNPKVMLIAKSVLKCKLQNLESFRNLNPFDTLMGHAAYVIFCQADRVGRAGLCLGWNAWIKGFFSS